MIIYWPRGILKPRHAPADPAPATIAGPAALSGFRQVVGSPAAVWSIAYNQISVSGNAVKIWRALAAQIGGRANSIVIPIYDRERLRLVGIDEIDDEPHGDGEPLSDGAEYTSHRTHVIATADVARGAIRMTVETILGGEIEPGHQYSIGHRLYRVMAIEAVDGAETTFTFWPTARDAIIAGAELEFDLPVCKVRLLADDAMNLALENGRNGFASIAFIEDPT